MSAAHLDPIPGLAGAASVAPVTRRAFLMTAAAGGAALIVGVPLPAAAAAFEPAVFVRIDADGTVTVTVPRTELGQGPRTALPMIVAEELEADWATIRVEPALAHPDRYGSMATGGSSSVREFIGPLRRAGAAAREMLREAAARTWQVPVAECLPVEGHVEHAPSNRRLPYGALVKVASSLPVPDDPPLKDPTSFRLIGTSPARLDTPEKLRGAARFGLDSRQPGMLVAVVARCPVFGGKVRSWDAAPARAVLGVRQVVEVPTGIAVVADDTWAALAGRQALRVEWEEGEAAACSSASIRELFAAKLADGSSELRPHRADGDFAAAWTAASRRLEARYELPFLAHAPLEPLNCCADLRPGSSVEVWAPTQAPQWPLGDLAALGGVPVEQVRVHTTLCGGGFGRRLMPDFVVEAAQVSKAAGAPVQVVWSRADDLQHDQYRPASMHRLAAALDPGGRLVAWRHAIAAPSIGAQLNPAGSLDHPDAIDGAANLPYAIPNLLVEYAHAATPVPVGWWRSVYNTQNAVANECFLDEVAAAMGADPLTLRLELLPKESRLRGALQRVAETSGWGSRPVSGRGQGLACHESFGSAVAVVAEASVSGARVVVHRVWSAIDCGRAIHLDGVKAQLEGSVAMALSALLYGEITIAKGRVEQANFDGYPLLTIGGMPQVEVSVLTSGDPIGGVGEPGLPPVAPAVLNALAAATGTRVRRLPVRLG